MENLYYLKQLFMDICQKTGLFVAGAIIGYWNQCPDGLKHLLYFLAVLVIIDFILGAANALRNGIFNSNGVKNSIIKFITYAAALLLGHGIDCGFGLGFTFQFALVLLVVTREGTSVIENLEKNGFAFPKYITSFLANKEEGIMRHLPQEEVNKIYDKMTKEIDNENFNERINDFNVRVKNEEDRIDYEMLLSKEKKEDDCKCKEKE